MACREDEAVAAQPPTSDHDKETNRDALPAVEVNGQVGLKRDVTLLNGIALVIGVMSAQAFSSHPKVHSLGSSWSDGFGRLGKMRYSRSPWLPLLL